MWTRKELKANAKMILKRTYKLTFAVLLAASIISGIGGGVDTVIELAERMGVQMAENLLIKASVLSWLITIFITNPLSVGKNRFLMQSREFDIGFTSLFSGFDSGEYGKNVMVLLFRNLKIALWSLLLVIPGIIKSYEYYFVPYLLAENPNMSAKRVFELSREMTRGCKMRIFTLELSFIGWYLLGALCLGVGVFFVNPYYEATLAELYAAQRACVLRAGIVGEDELCGFSGYTTF